MIISSKELIERYANGERDFTNYSEIDFQRVNLPGIDLSDVRLAETFFSGANLIGANLSNAFLRYAHLDLYCNLMNSNMTGANLHGAMMSNANLSQSDLQDADLREAELIDVNLSSANLINANLENTLLNCVHLTRDTLSEHQINSAKMRGSNLITNKEPLKKLNFELFSKLDKLCYGQMIFDSEGDDHNMYPFVWDVTEKEHIHVDEIIRWGKYSENTESKTRSINYFHYPYKSSDLQANERYNTLIEIFRNDLVDAKIHWLEETCGYNVTLDVYLIGKTKTGSFAGLSVANLSWSLSDIR
jgi:Pentapeptide repeats (8 copies)/Nuclease A inhibitor-like protein